MAGSDTPGEGGAGALRGASLLVLLQVVSRAVTFVANQLLLRFLTAQLLGISTQLEVYYLSVLFFARESLRVAIQRHGDTGSDGGPADEKKPGDEQGHVIEKRAQEAQAAVNLAYVSVALGVVVAGVLGWAYLSSVNPEILASTPKVVESLYIYALAAFAELLSEPAFVVMQIRLKFGARAAAESIATFARCTVTLASAAWASKMGLDVGVLPFALGQVSYGLGLLLAYSWFALSLAGREGFSMTPRRLQADAPATAESRNSQKAAKYALSYFHRPTLQLASSMLAQSLVKHVLTQGDTFLVSVLSTPTAQGVYALASNYGGLIARLLFQPIEESSRNYFSRLLADAPAPEATPLASNGQKPEGVRSADTHNRPSPAVHKAASDLRALLRFYVLLSLPIMAVGVTAAPLCLSLVAGPRWAASGAGDALAAYVFYIPLLALNGVAEAFVASVATEREVHRQSVWMGGFSLVFAVAGAVFMRLMDLGAIGLVAANCINMICRIAWCEGFISKYFARHGVRWGLGDMLPSPAVVAAAAVTAQAARSIARDAGATGGPGQLLFELIKVAGVAVPFLVVLAFVERNFLVQCYRTVRGTRTSP